MEKTKINKKGTGNCVVKKLNNINIFMHIYFCFIFSSIFVPVQVKEPNFVGFLSFDEI